MPAKSILNAEQKEAFKAIQKFLTQPGLDTFVLKGYAGTGKTFLMQYLAQWLDDAEQKFCLLASTGRASTVLRGKTGLSTRTVHGELYHFNKVEGTHEDLPEDAPAEKFGQMRLQFLLRGPDEIKRLYIVDEASMLSSELPTDRLLAFGSGILLNDFFDAAGRNKIIFVGDPCQLPPVGQSNSPALDLDWLRNQKRRVASISLETIERTRADNDILLLAARIREMIINSCNENWPKLPAANRTHVKLHPGSEALFRTYLERYRNNDGRNTSLAIARSNRQVQAINREFRKELYGEYNMPLQIDDVLLINQNNYKVPLTNGDFVTVLDIIGGPLVQAGLHFQKVKVKALASGLELELLLSLEILYGERSQFSKEEATGLMVDFSRRMMKEGIKPNTGRFKERMIEDDYLNCLQATYGYAVTCHKAQGGEWDDVFLFLDSKMYGMPRQELFRWWYTAVTRAKKELNLENEWWIGI